YNVLKTMQGVNPRVVITFGDKQEGDDDDNTSSAVKRIKEYHEKMVKPLFGDNDEKYDEGVCDDFKNPDGDINMLVVKDKLLTGFDAPIAGVLYLDKSIQEHGLLQAVARVNRVYKDKDFGLIVDYWGVFGKLNKAIDMYNDAESGFNQFDEDDIAEAIYGPVDEKNKLAEAYKVLLDMFTGIPKNATSNEWQKQLANEEKRKEFYDKLKCYANLLNLALTNREIFIEVGYEQIEKYRTDYLFYKKLKDAVTIRYDDSIDYSKYEDGIKNLIDTFVNATGISTVIYPVSISDEKSMSTLLETIESYEARGDVIKTKIESKLKQIRYDDPLIFEEFSTKIKKTIAEYNENRDADKYYATMEAMADDFGNGRVSHDYPANIANDSDAKAFYGSVYTVIKQKYPAMINKGVEEMIAENGMKIKEAIAENTKRDWKHNEIVHKTIHRELDNYLFDMFERMGMVIDNSNVDMIDLIIDEIMKVAVSRY
ncbi:MAG: type I restriction endonuclease subunit R, partial [Enterococcus sp.]|nr:type I restriction endonuclease subunit R [Enterococcus sp.]